MRQVASVLSQSRPLPVNDLMDTLGQRCQPRRIAFVGELPAHPVALALDHDREADLSSRVAPGGAGEMTRDEEECGRHRIRPALHKSRRNEQARFPADPGIVAEGRALARAEEAPQGKLPLFEQRSQRRGFRPDKKRSATLT